MGGGRSGGRRRDNKQCLSVCRPDEHYIVGALMCREFVSPGEHVSGGWRES